MIRFRTLGTLALTDDAGRPLESRATQPKRVALLAYLAIARPRAFHRRDTLLGLFWPELDDAHARGSLNVALHHLRRTLGAQAIVTTGMEQVALDPERVWCDATAFDDALAAGSLEEALDLYRGELLPGFFLSSPSGFEAWLELERSRLQEAARAAAVTLVERAQEAGRLADAAGWARRALALSPTDERSVRKLVAVLDAAGERAGAIQAYEEFAQRLRSDLDVEPAPETSRLVSQIRARQEPRALPLEPSPDAGARSSPAASATSPSDGTRPRPDGTDPRRSLRRPRRRFRVVVAGALGLVALWLVGGIMGGSRDGSRSPVAAEAAAGVPVGDVLLSPGRWARAGATTVAVLPFAVRGTGDADYMGEGMVDLLSTQLNGVGAIRTVDPRALFSRLQQPDGALTELERARVVARHFGARYALLGSVVDAGSRLQLTASLYERDGGPAPIARAAAAGPADAVFDLVDDLTREIVAGIPGGPAERLQRLAASTTSSLPALRAYLEGERLFRDGRFLDAFASFERATQLDTTFALAFYRASQSSTWDGPWSATKPTAERAMALSDRLSQHDATLLRAWHAYLKGDVEAAYQAYQGLLARHHDDIDAWSGVGEVVFHWGAPLGWPLTQSRAMWQRVLFLEPNNGGALLHLAKVAAAEGRMAELDSLLLRSLPLGASTDLLEVRALHAFGSDDTARQRSILLELENGEHNPKGPVHVVAAFVDPAAALRLVRGITWPESLRRIEATVLETQLEAARGRWRAAAGAAGELPAARALEFRAAMALLPFRPMRAGALRPLVDSLRTLDAGVDPPGHGWPLMAAPGINEPRRLYLLGMLSLRLGDADAALRYAERLRGFDGERTDESFARRFARTVEAQVAFRRGAADRALGLLGAPALEPDASPTGTLSYPLAQEMWLRAEALRAVGRSEDALRWYAALRHQTAFALPYLAPSHLRRAELHQAAGRAGDAARHYDRFIDMWRDADAESRELVELALERRG